MRMKENKGKGGKGKGKKGKGNEKKVEKKKGVKEKEKGEGGGKERKTRTIWIRDSKSETVSNVVVVYINSVIGPDHDQVQLA